MNSPVPATWILWLSFLGFLIPRISAAEVTGEVVEATTGQRLPARIYLRDELGGWHFVESAATNGSAIRYEKRNWVNARAEEFHTTISAHPFRAKLAPGRYELIVERGKEYAAVTNSVTVSTEAMAVRIPLKRWINLAARHWYSGETHVHRLPSELPNLQLAEDLNVAFPLTYWVTRGYQAPASGDKNQSEPPPEGLVPIDDTHVFWPRNTEWEIFTINGRAHTLGAVFALGHRKPFELGVPPVRAVAERARAEGALLDIDKPDWPWSMTLPTTMGAQLYELANNHIWRTEFGFTNWNSPTPVWLRPPLQPQSGNEREWVLFTLENYYTLLNCGLNLMPTAGTANGVHPVPLGFSRAYVHLPGGFSYEQWKEGLAAGRSFITTGPMLFATVNRRAPGERFASTESSFNALVEGEILSEQPLSFAEILHDGQPVRTIMGRNERTDSGAYRTVFRAEIAMTQSGWLAVRAWEDRPGGRVRYAHTAPWQVTLEGRPRVPRVAERDYLVERVRSQIERSRGVLPAEAIQEYEQALQYYQGLPARSEIDPTARGDHFDAAQWRGIPGRVYVRPYPGGRHPRMGFFDGALAPQRETKISVFTPWDPDSFVVVDVPEAIWSNLGLTYLAHTHIDTIWDQQGVKLPPLEWARQGDGSLTHERELPNGIRFGARVVPHRDRVEMELWLKNGTAAKLTNLRVQNCVMLKGATGFSAQSNGNKRLESPFAGVRSDDGRRWILTAWDHCDRVWANPPVPCIHSDPKFPDLAPGETGRLKGWLWFYEGSDLDAYLVRLKATL